MGSPSRSISSARDGATLRDKEMAPPAAADEAPLHLRQSELRILGGDHKIACQEKLEATCNSPPLDRSHQRLLRRGDGDASQPSPRQARPLAAQETFKIHAGTESATRAGQHSHTQISAGVQLVDGVSYPTAHISGQRVLGTRAG